MRAAARALLLLGALTLLLQAREGLSTPIGPLVLLCPLDDLCKALNPSFLPPSAHMCDTNGDCSKTEMCCPSACIRTCVSQFPGVPPEHGPDGIPPKHPLSPDGNPPIVPWPPNGNPPIGPWPPNGNPPIVPWPPNGNPPIGPWPPNGNPPIGPWPPDAIPPNGPWPPDAIPPNGPWPPDGILPEGPSSPDGPVGILPDA